MEGTAPGNEQQSDCSSDLNLQEAQREHEALLEEESVTSWQSDSDKHARINILADVVSYIENKRPDWAKNRVLQRSTELEESLYRKSLSLGEYTCTATLHRRIDAACYLLAKEKEQERRRRLSSVVVVPTVVVQPPSSGRHVSWSCAPIVEEGALPSENGRGGRTVLPAESSPNNKAESTRPNGILTNASEVQRDVPQDPSVKPEPSVICPLPSSQSFVGLQGLLDKMVSEPDVDEKQETVQSSSDGETSAVPDMDEPAARSFQHHNRGIPTTDMCSFDAGVDVGPTAVNVAAERERALIGLQNRLRLLLHAVECTSIGECTSCPGCPAARLLLHHVASCRSPWPCPVPHCTSTRFVLEHHRDCTDIGCPLCAVVRVAANTTPAPADDPDSTWAQRQALHRQRLVESQEERKRKREAAIAEGKVPRRRPSSMRQRKACDGDTLQYIGANGQMLGDFGPGFFVRQVQEGSDTQGHIHDHDMSGLSSQTAVQELRKSTGGITISDIANGQYSERETSNNKKLKRSSTPYLPPPDTVPVQGGSHQLSRVSPTNAHQQHNFYTHTSQPSHNAMLTFLHHPTSSMDMSGIMYANANNNHSNIMQNPGGVPTFQPQHHIGMSLSSDGSTSSNNMNMVMVGIDNNQGNSSNDLRSQSFVDMNSMIAFHNNSMPSMGSLPSLGSLQSYGSLAGLAGLWSVASPADDNCGSNTVDDCVRESDALVF